MLFSKIFSQPIKLEVLKQRIGIVYKRQFSNSSVNFGIEFFNKRISLNKYNLNKRFNKNNQFNKINNNKFKLTSMMGLVTISDSIKDALFKSEVIPTVIHDEKFTPKGFLMIQFKNSDKEVTMGNTLQVEDTQEKPVIHFTLNLPDTTPTTNTTITNSNNDTNNINNNNNHNNGNNNNYNSKNIIDKDDLFTLILTDPDAPTKGDEKWSEYCHYIVKDIKLNEFKISDEDSNEGDNSIESFGEKLTTIDLKGKELVPFLGPGPPPKTGLHRYVFLLYKQNKNKEPQAPIDRPNYGTGIPGYGAAEYAEKYGLELYAVNFFYAKNKVQ